MPFVGRRQQRGHGLGSVLGGLFRTVIPFIKQNVATVGRSLAKTGMNIVGDVLEGKKLKDAARKHIPRAMKRTAQNLNWGAANPLVSTVGSNLLQTGVDIAGDVIAGKKFKRAAQQHIPAGIKRVVGSVASQRGRGDRRRVVRQHHRDIFF